MNPRVYFEIVLDVSANLAKIPEKLGGIALFRFGNNSVISIRRWPETGFKSGKFGSFEQADGHEQKRF